MDPPRPKHMVREMKKALEFYRASQQLYRVCVALKNLGEAEWKLGYKDLAMDYFDQAKAQSQELEQADRANVLVNLAVAAMRVGDRTLEIRYLGECLKECPENWTDRILSINERLTELTQ
jgi:tetratricopeptide (TPR) repeat protein